MVYDKQDWAEGVPPDRLNHMEEGIGSAHELLEALEARVAVLESSPPPTPEPDGEASPGLFFDATDIQQPGAFPHQSYPHWWPYTIRSWYNETEESIDWYSKAMNNPDHKDFASSKKWGGDSRVRPMYRDPLEGSTAEWTAVDRLYDIDTAIDYGHDGFFADIINTWKPRVDELTKALRNARADNPDRYETFVIIPMIDANSSGAYSPTNTAAEYLLKFKDVTKWVDGKMLWAVWHPGARALSVWEDISEYMANAGTPNKMVGTWNSSYTSTSNGPSAFAHLTYGEGPWGAGTADAENIKASAATIASYANSAHSRGKIFVNPVRAAEVRPSSKGPWWDESDGTRALEAQWQQVMGNANADWVEPCTWSDWTEDTAFAPGTHYGYSRLIMSAWFMYKWKTGDYPEILKDAVILSHRQHNLSADVVYSGQTDTLPQRTNSPKTSPQNRVEAVVWLTAPATVRFVDASGNTEFEAPAGMSRWNKTLVNGVAPKVEIWRNGVKVAGVKSTRTVDAEPWRTDWTYWQFDNLHETTHQMRIPGPNPPYA